MTRQLNAVLLGFQGATFSLALNDSHDGSALFALKTFRFPGVWRGFPHAFKGDLFPVL